MSFKRQKTQDSNQSRIENFFTTASVSQQTQEVSRAAASSSSNPDSIVNSSSKELSVASSENDPAHFSSRRLFDDDRKHLLSSKTSLNSSFRFPKNKQDRRYNKVWEDTFPWLRYSESEDGAYCSVCLAFKDESEDTYNPEFVQKPFRDWKNALGDKRGRLKLHAQSERHQKSLEKGENFLAVSNQDKKSVTQTLSRAYDDKITRNRESLLSIIDIVITLGKRNIALRGNWNKEISEEDGNFRYFINWKAQFDSVLKDHICKENPYGKYLSPLAQNEFIECCEKEIREKIIARCTESPFFSVMADECADCSNQAQLSICVRYLYWDSAENIYQVTEDFCGFIELKTTNAENISNSILSSLRKWGFDLSKLRGQGYDGCSTMSGEVSGVKTRIVEELPNARFFVHCRSHCLNLVIVNSCQSVPIIRNFMSILGKITWFINGSSKRKNIMKDILNIPAENNLEFDMLYDEEEQIFSQEKCCLPALCETRWTSRVDTLTWLLKHYSNILDILDSIQQKTTGHSDATSYKATLMNFEILIVAVVTQHVLGYLRPLSIALQAVSCDLVQAHTQARLLVQTLNEVRQNSIESFNQLFKRASSIAEGNEINVSKPRTSGRQRHRANAAAETIEDHFRVNLFLPFIDHVLSHLNTRFPEDLKPLLYGFYLMPLYIHKLDDNIIPILIQEYSTDLPSPDDFPQEIHRWRVSLQCAVPKPITLESALLQASHFFPNVRRILQLLLCIPVGSCCCERSFSALRRLKTWNRSSMTESRLCGLSMLHIHRSDEVGDIKPIDVLKRWDATGHRKIMLAFDKK